MAQRSVGVLESSDTLSSFNEVQVEILGQQYVFGSAHDAQRVRQVASLVDEVAGGLRSRFASVSVARLSVLALMQLGFELLSLREEYRALQQEFERESERLLGLISGQ